MKKLHILAFLIPMLAVCSSAAGITLADRGKTDYVIVTADSPSEKNKFILGELKKFLKDVTGADFPSAANAGMTRKHRIFLGIAPAGFDIDQLPNQTHCVKTISDDLYLFGKGVNGTRYAVYDFLENVIGIRFFDTRGGIFIPRKSTLEIPALDRCRQFDFSVRRTSVASWYWIFDVPHGLLFAYRNGQNESLAGFFNSKCGVNVPKDDLAPLYPLGHTLAYYVPLEDQKSRYSWIRAFGRNLWKEHPEYFSMINGKRVANHQRCFSNPGLRKLLTERLLTAIKNNPDCDSFDLSANDTPGRLCGCAECLALEEKYGCTGGPLFDYLMELGPIAQKQYPEKRITTLVYRKNQTQHPPRNVAKFPDNIAPVFAPIDDNFAQDWSHPDNRETYEDLKQWCRLCKSVFVWYYPNPYSGPIIPPLGNLNRCMNDIVLMKKAGVSGVLCEHNVGVCEMIGLSELQSYVMLKLFQDSTLDPALLIREFTDFEYGKAAPLMRRYLEELEQESKKWNLKLRWDAASSSYSSFQHLTSENLVRWSSCFDEMEALTAGSRAGENVRRVRINLDLAVLRKYYRIKQDYPQFAKTPQQLKKSIMDTYHAATSEPYFRKEANIVQYRRWLKSVEDVITFAMIEADGEGKPLPKEIFGNIPQKQIFVSIPYVNRTGFLPDPDAAFKIVSCNDKPAPGPSLPFQAHFYDGIAKKNYPAVGQVTAEMLGPRGKFKFYKMGQIKLTPDCEFKMGKDNWFALRVSLGNAYEMGSFGDAEVYASLKFEGPAFYKEDAGKQNKVYCDRIVVVRLK